MAYTDFEKKIANAIAGSRYKWRTVKGISSEIGAAEIKVFETLENSNNFIRANRPNERGDALYTTAERYRKETSLMNRLLGAAANTVYDD